MDALLARYASAGAWTSPSLSALGVSSKNVDASAAGRHADTIGSGLRRAMRSTPDDAREFGGENSFNMRRWRGQTLIVESLCFNRDFFFQAEDGIRDKLVTGVQTCALPI